MRFTGPFTGCWTLCHPVTQSGRSSLCSSVKWRCERHFLQGHELIDPAKPATQISHHSSGSQPERSGAGHVTPSPPPPDLQQIAEVRIKKGEQGFYGLGVLEISTQGQFIFVASELVASHHIRAGMRVRDRERDRGCQIPFRDTSSMTRRPDYRFQSTPPNSITFWWVFFL